MEQSYGGGRSFFASERSGRQKGAESDEKQQGASRFRCGCGNVVPGGGAKREHYVADGGASSDARNRQYPHTSALHERVMRAISVNRGGCVGVRSKGAGCP